MSYTKQIWRCRLPVEVPVNCSNVHPGVEGGGFPHLKADSVDHKWTGEEIWTLYTLAVRRHLFPPALPLQAEVEVPVTPGAAGHCIWVAGQCFSKCLLSVIKGTVSVKMDLKILPELGCPIQMWNYVLLQLNRVKLPGARERRDVTSASHWTVGQV